jgi:hypothetical protein
MSSRIWHEMADLSEKLKPERLKLKLQAQFFNVFNNTTISTVGTSLIVAIHVRLLQRHRHEFAAYRANRTINLVSRDFIKPSCEVLVDGDDPAA